MKKQCSIVLAVAATLVIGLGSLALVQGSEIVAFVYGNTVVQDAEGDLLLRNCDSNSPGTRCSLPPGESHDLPGYFDIKTAKITEIGDGMVDLFIALYEPIPAAPPYGFVNYFWQFAGGCVGENPQPGDKSAISVVWLGGTWRANWVYITSCSTRAIATGDPVPFQFTEDGVKVRVALDDLLTATNAEGVLVWQAGVRRMPFFAPPFTTTAVDYVPNVVTFTPPPLPEAPATWEPR